MKQTLIPLYERIANDLREQITAGRYNPEEPICTEKSLSEQYDVSRITAKNAVLALEQEGLVYRKRGLGTFVLDTEDRQAQEQAGGQKTLGLLMPFESSKGGAFQIIESMSAQLASHHALLTLHVSSQGAEKERELLASLRDANLGGLAYYPNESPFPVEILDEFVQQNKPVIVLDKSHAFRQFSSITSDNYAGGYQLTKHLIDYGHSAICYLSRFPGETVPSIRERYQGYQQCLLDNNIPFAPYFVLAEQVSEDNVNYPMLTHIVNRLFHEGVTAIECENDELAFYVSMCCDKLGISIPGELSITGFDNIHWATMGDASITTIEQDFPAMGKAIADLFLLPRYTAKRRVIPIRFIPRASTGAILR